MTGNAEVFVSPGTRHWRSDITRKLTHKYSSGGALLVVYRQPSGRIGFDLDEEGEAIFRVLIGDGLSWSQREGSSVRYVAGSATEYVRSLFAPGQHQPITVSDQQTRLSDGGDDLPEIGKLAMLDVDENMEAFVAGIAKLAETCSRVCVHSIAQWETAIVSTNTESVRQLLQAACMAQGLRFRATDSETQLPAW